MNKKLILFMTSLSLAAAPMGVFASEYNGPTVSIEAVEERATLQAATGEYRSWNSMTADGAVSVWVPVQIRWLAMDAL